MNRRAFLGGLVGVAGALVLPASVTENAAEARRWWALGAMPGRVSRDIYLRHHELAPIMLVESAMGVSRLDGVMLHGAGELWAVGAEINRHARWLREHGARDLMLYDRREWTQ